MQNRRITIALAIAFLSILVLAFPAKAASLMEWNVPGDVTSIPQYLTPDDSSNIWFTEYGSDEIGKFGFGTFTEYMLPEGSRPVGIAYSDDKIWFTESEKGIVARMPTGGGFVDEFNVVDSAQMRLWGIALQDSTRIWFTSTARNAGDETSRIGLLSIIDSSNIQVRQWVLPGSNRDLRGIVYSSNTGAWFIDYNRNTIGNVPDALTSEVREWSLPVSGSSPFDLALDLNGNLWFTESQRNRIGMLNPHTNEITEYLLPTPNSEPYGITVDSSNRVWFAEHAGNKIGRYDPETNTFTEFSRTSSGAPWGITTDRNRTPPIWFSDGVWNRIGRLSPYEGLTTSIGTALSSASTTSTTTRASTTYTLSTLTGTFPWYNTSTVISNRTAVSLSQRMTTSTQYTATETVTMLQVTTSQVTTALSTVTELRTVTTTITSTSTSYATTTTQTVTATTYATSYSYVSTTTVTDTETVTVTGTTTTYEYTTSQPVGAYTSPTMLVAFLFGATFLTAHQNRRSCGNDDGRG
jgi:virginiamycin B lyase